MIINNKKFSVYRYTRKMAESEREVCILCDKEMEEGIIHIGEKPIKSRNNKKNIMYLRKWL